ncbi:MAG: YbjQ family protein [Bacillota bacterium]|jgi:uncharacterized protein YbjQ (UPF0145 family)
MLLATSDLRTEYQVLGMVQGSRVKAVHLGKDILAGLRRLVGGEVTEYSKMIEDARRAAVADMIAEAEKLGANAIIGVRYASSTVGQGIAEIVAYGTAVKI